MMTVAVKSCYRQLTLLVAALPAVAPAAELYSWHAVDSVGLQTKKFEMLIHQRARARHELHYLDQVRAGGILRWKSGFKNLIPYVGAYYQPQQIREDTWSSGRRFFAGLERPFTLHPSVSLTLRVAAERHSNTGRPDYNRYRTFERVVLGRGRVAPFLQNEWLAVRQGFHSVRNSGGLRVKVNGQITLEGGYLYDVRRAFWGGHRQAIVTAVRWTPKVQ